LQAIPRQLQGVAVHDALPLVAENCFVSQPNLSHAADQVKGSREFYRLYRILKPGSPDKRMVDSALDKLKQNMMAGEKVQRPQWAPYYVKRYGINNLWKYNMSKAARLIYTILSENGRWVVVSLEMFLTHKEYEKRFGYC